MRAFNPNYPENQVALKAWHLYSDLYGATADLEPNGHAYLEEYSAIGICLHAVTVLAKASYGEGTVGYQSARYQAERISETEYQTAMDRYFNAVYDLETA